MPAQPKEPMRTGVATVNVLVDSLGEFDVLQLPERRTRHIAWIAPFLGHSVIEFPAQENLTCLFTQTDTVLPALEQFPMALVLLVLEQGEPVPWTLDAPDTDYRKRLLIVRRRENSPRHDELLAILQTILFELYRWGMRCEEIVRWSGNVQALIDASSDIFANWIDITDATYTLLAHVRNMEPPDTLSRNLVKLGCHSAAQVGAARDEGVFGEWTEQSGIEVFEPTDMVPFKHVTYIMKTDKVYRGHVVMVCNNAEPTPGLVDLFETFANNCMKIVVGRQDVLFTQAPYEGFLTHLLDNPSPRQDYIENQRAIIGIDASATFCLAIIDNSNGSYSEQPLHLLSNAKSALPQALSMMYENELIVLFHAENFDSIVIENQMSKLEAFCVRYDCTAFRSGVFFAIEDLALAYGQAKITWSHRFDIENSRLSTDSSRRTAVYRFTDAFCFLLDSPDETTRKLVDFAVDNSHLDIMTHLQLGSTVCDVKMLYCFLVNERKATPTAEYLHMHRNNVLHRITSIEKRYHLDLDDFFTRQYLLACYRLKISRSAKFRKLLL